MTGSLRQQQRKTMNSACSPMRPGLEEPSFKFGRTPFYFVRHGETLANRYGIVQGQTDSRLTEAGRRSAETLAQKLREHGIGSIYSSPLERAWTTASIISEATNTPVRALPGLMERHWGTYEGKPKAERPEECNPATVETIEAFSSRILTALASIGGANPVLVVSHSGVFRVLVQHLGALSDGGGASIAGGQLIRIEPPTKEDSSWRISRVES